MAKNKPKYEDDFLEDEMDIELECNSSDAQKIHSIQRREHKSRRSKSLKERGKYF